MSDSRNERQELFSLYQSYRTRAQIRMSEIQCARLCCPTVAAPILPLVPLSSQISSSVLLSRLALWTMKIILIADSIGTDRDRQALSTDRR